MLPSARRIGRSIAPSPSGKLTLGHRPVGLAKTAGQQRRGKAVLCRQHQAGGVAVDAVHRAKRAGRAPRLHQKAPAVGKGSPTARGRGVDQNARGLVQHRGEIILIHDFQRHRLRRHRGLRLRRQLSPPRSVRRQGAGRCGRAGRPPCMPAGLVFYRPDQPGRQAAAAQKDPTAAAPARPPPPKGQPHPRRPPLQTKIRAPAATPPGTRILLYQIFHAAATQAVSKPRPGPASHPPP